MNHAAIRATTLTVVAAVAFAACTSESASVGGANPGASPESSFNTIDQGSLTAANEVLCTPDGDAAVDHPDWTSGSADPQINPIILSSLLSVGPSRVLYNVTDANHRVIASPDVETSVSFYALERDPDEPVATISGAYLDTQIGRGMYRAAVDLDCAGQWGAIVTAQLEDGSTASERIRFRVHPVGTTPAIGAPAPRSDSPTASTIDEIRLISTDANPFPGAYEKTVAETVTSGKPSLVFFATPAFCQTGYCGPTVNLVKSVAIDYEDEIGYVNVEPYKLHMTENGLQPELDEDGRLQPVESVIDYGIPVEPYLFLVDAEGDVFAKFEGVVGADELRGAIEDVLGRAT